MYFLSASGGGAYLRDSGFTLSYLMFEVPIIFTGTYMLLTIKEDTQGGKIREMQLIFRG